MTSREIAELTGKEHGHVMRDIRVLAEQLGDDFGGAIQNWIHPQNGQTYEQYELDKDTTLCLVAGYSAVVRMKIIKRWQELEQAQPAYYIPQTYTEALRLAADLAEQVQVQAAQIEAQRPAVEFLGRYVEAKSAKSLREAAKVLGIKERVFIAKLLDDGILYRQASGNLLPMAEYQHRGFFEVKTGESGGHAYVQTRFTPSGIAWIAGRMEAVANVQ